MATYTPNYNFYLPALGDGALNGKPWGVRINANFTTIDTTLHTFDVAITGLSASVTTLEGQIGAGGVPAFTSGDNGKVLGISSGAMVWISSPYIAHASGHLAGGTDAISWVTVHGRGSSTSKPAADSTNAGYFYFDTTIGKLQRSNGTAWEDCEGVGGGGSSEDVYAATETLTNKVWVDGKAIYRKVINFGTLPNSTTKSVAHGVSGATFFTDCRGMCKRSDGTHLALPAAWPGAVSVACYPDSTNVNIVTGGDLTAYTTCYVVLEYTK